ncbi:hypothetical protein, partial [Escherichia coli]|uniref:hypothetical protein n=1 Tax=Escherichia coli TaxID=562 RepID=UPI001BB0BA08
KKKKKKKKKKFTTKKKKQTNKNQISKVKKSIESGEQKKTQHCKILCPYVDCKRNKPGSDGLWQ